MSFLLLALACAPKGTEQLDDLMDLGAYEAACQRALGDRSLEDHVAARTWEATSVQLRARALDADELGGTPKGWGAWEVVIGADAEVVPAMTASLALIDDEGRRWTACSECGPDWVMDQLAVGDVVEITFASHERTGGAAGCSVPSERWCGSRSGCLWP